MKQSKYNHFIEQAKVSNVGELIRCRKMNELFLKKESMFYALKIQQRVLQLIFDNKEEFWKWQIQQEVKTYQTLYQEYIQMTFEYHALKHIILIADEDSKLRQSLYQVLKQNNYILLCAKNGKEILQLVQFRPRVIILDVYQPLPSMKVCNRLRNLKTYSQYGEIPIILFSAKLSKKYKKKIKQMRGIVWIAKPTRMSTLLEQIKIRIPRTGIEMTL